MEGIEMTLRVEGQRSKAGGTASGFKRLASDVWVLRAGFQSAVSGFCFLASVFCLLAACSLPLPLPQAQSDQTRYYLLTSADILPGTDTAATLQQWVIGVRAVDVPAYLRGKSFAVRSHANEIMFLDFVRWGEPLDQGIARVLAENLRSLKNVARVSTQPFRADEQRDFEIMVNVTACEGTADGDVRFAASWRILAPVGSARTVAEGNYAASGLRWDGRDHGQLAARLSEALAGLSRDIAAALPKEPAK
jgi:uncharacterized lipoprotein YmbA